MEDFERGIKNCHVLHLTSSAPFIVFELFFNSLSCGKMVIIQMIPVHRNANELCGDAVDCSFMALAAFCLYW